MARTAADVAANLQLTAAERAQSDTSGSDTELLPDYQLITLWQRMGDLYGHRWSSAYGQPTMTDTDARGRLRHDADGHAVERLNPTLISWQRVLRGITPAELQNGLKACATRGEEWPPSAPQFRERCRPHREPYERAEFQGKALPQLPADRNFALDAIAQLRGRMGGSHG